MAIACVVLDGQPLPFADRDSPSESRGWNAVAAINVFESFQPVSPDERPCVPRALQSDCAGW